MNKELKKALIDSDMTSLELASKLGISCAYLSQIINGHKNGQPMRLKIAQELGLTYEDLWDK